MAEAFSLPKSGTKPPGFPDGHLHRYNDLEIVHFRFLGK